MISGGSHNSQVCLLKYYENLALVYKAVQDRSQHATSLSDSRISLFNFHSTRFAQRLIDKNVKSLVMVEMAQSYARDAKVGFFVVEMLLCDLCMHLMYIHRNIAHVEFFEALGKD